MRNIEGKKILYFDVDIFNIAPIQLGNGSKKSGFEIDRLDSFEEIDICR